jgi:hypothetical protein
MATVTWPMSEVRGWFLSCIGLIASLQETVVKTGTNRKQCLTSIKEGLLWASELSYLAIVYTHCMYRIMPVTKIVFWTEKEIIH